MTFVYKHFVNYARVIEQHRLDMNLTRMYAAFREQYITRPDYQVEVLRDPDNAINQMNDWIFSQINDTIESKLKFARR